MCLVAWGKQDHPRLMIEYHGSTSSYWSYENHVAQLLWQLQFTACLPLLIAHDFSWHLDLGIQRESCCFGCVHFCANSNARFPVWCHWSWQRCSCLGTTLPLALRRGSVCRADLMFHTRWTFPRHFSPLLGFNFKLWACLLLSLIRVKMAFLLSRHCVFLQMPQLCRWNQECSFQNCWNELAPQVLDFPKSTHLRPNDEWLKKRS